MNKQELLKQHPELVKEIARGVISLYNKDKAFSLDSVVEEYLKEQIKPEWEIISWHEKNNPNNVTIINRGKERHEEFWAIHSVRRTLDNEIFTVGDHIEGKDTIREIRATDEYKGGIQLVTNMKLNYGIALCEAVKVEPVFTTEDGVALYDGDHYHLVDGFFRYNGGNSIARPDQPLAGFKTFSTKEAAEEYILMNRPVLSVQDVWNIYGGHIDSPEQLRELAKSKL